MQFARVNRVLAVTLLLAAQAAASDSTTDNFDAQRAGSPPNGWVVAVTGTGTPKWTVAKDDSAPSGTCVLKQSGWTSNPTFPLCVKEGSLLKDGFVEVNFKSVSGTNDQAAGVVWRYRDPSNYYVARANALENNVVLYKVEAGKRKALDIVGRVGGYGVQTEVPAHRWSTLRVEFTGLNARVTLNGKTLFSVEDTTFCEAGLVGLWTKADSVTLFDNFTYGAEAGPETAARSHSSRAPGPE